MVGVDGHRACRRDRPDRPPDRRRSAPCARRSAGARRGTAVIERVLRSLRVAIALVALVDPRLTVAGRARPRVGVVVQDGPSMTLPSAGGTGDRRAAARRVSDTLARDLEREFEIVDGA